VAFEILSGRYPKTQSTPTSALDRTEKMPILALRSQLNQSMKPMPPFTIFVMVSSSTTLESKLFEVLIQNLEVFVFEHWLIQMLRLFLALWTASGAAACNARVFSS
jgi:hypothetical protein